MNTIINFMICVAKIIAVLIKCFFVEGDIDIETILNHLKQNK